MDELRIKGRENFHFPTNLTLEIHWDSLYHVSNIKHFPNKLYLNTKSKKRSEKVLQYIMWLQNGYIIFHSDLQHTGQQLALKHSSILASFAENWS